MKLKEKIKKDIFGKDNKLIDILEKTIQNCGSMEEKKTIKEYCNSIYIKNKISFTDLSISKDREIYNTILIVYVNIKNPEKVYEVHNILIKNILYATIIIFQYENKKKIGVSKVRENCVNVNKNVSGNIIFSSWSIKNYNDIILQINNIDIDDIKNVKELYNKIYSIVKDRNNKVVTVSRAVKIICNSFIVKDKQLLKEELEKNCCVIYAPKRKRNKYQKSEKTNIKCIEKDEIWDFLNKDIYYSKIIKNKNIRDFLEIEEKYRNDYDENEEMINCTINNYQIKLNHKGEEIVIEDKKDEIGIFKCKMFDETLNCCLIHSNVKSYIECVKYYDNCIYRKIK